MLLADEKATLLDWGCYDEVTFYIIFYCFSCSYLSPFSGRALPCGGNLLINRIGLDNPHKLLEHVRSITCMYGQQMNT